MKKPLFLFVLFFTLSTISQAQIIQDVGLTAGLSRSDLQWRYETAHSYYNHWMSESNLFNINAQVNFKGWKYFNPQAIVGYVEKGAQSNIRLHDANSPGNELVGILEGINQFNYITLGAGGKVKFPLNKWEAFVTAIPRIDYMVSSIQSDLILGSVGRDINKVNLGIRYGLGIAYKVSEKIDIQFSADRNHNFNSINYTEFSPGTFGLRIRDQTRYINLGISYALNEK